MSQLTEALQWRYATDVFDTERKVSDTDLATILEAGNLMPTAYGLQPFRFIVIADQELKNTLVPLSYNQAHVAANSHLIVLAARTDIDETMITEYTTRLETLRGLPAGTVDGFKDMMIGDLTNRPLEARLSWAQKQCYLALGGMMAVASELHVDNHAMEGFDVTAYNTTLGLTEKNLHATVILALGYRSSEDQKQHAAKVRVPYNDMVITR